MIHFISDTHFGHENILKFDNRPFCSIEEHDNQIIENINDSLMSEDILWHLGDVAWNKDAWMNFQAKVRKDISIRYIRGNHDHRIAALENLCVDAYFIKGDFPIWLSHYPHLSWPNSYHGSFHLFGHVHGMAKGIGRSMDVSANVIGYKPISFVEVIQKLSKISKNDT